MNNVLPSSRFEKKVERLREEMHALVERIISEHILAQDEVDLDEEISGIIAWREGIESGEIVNNKYR